VASVPDAAGPDPAGAPDAPAPDPLRREPTRPAAALRARGPVAGARAADGRLTAGAGVQLPAEGPDHYTWDPVLERFPSRGWRRWGTDRSSRRCRRSSRTSGRGIPSCGACHRGPVRPSGGRFGRTKDFIGHASHQNGLDIDI
jgi:hypothetical protein